jgi:hypothetical protein
MRFLAQCAPFYLQGNGSGSVVDVQCSPSSHQMVLAQAAEPLQHFSVPTLPWLAAPVYKELSAQLEMQ